MNPKRALHEYLARLYVPKNKTALFLQLKEYINAINLRYPQKEDSYKSRCPILLIQSKGKGQRETFEDYRVIYADFDNIGEKYALAYLSTERDGYPKRLDITSVKNLIIY